MKRTGIRWKLLPKSKGEVFQSKISSHVGCFSALAFLGYLVALFQVNFLDYFGGAFALGFPFLIDLIARRPQVTNEGTTLKIHEYSEPKPYSAYIPFIYHRETPEADASDKGNRKH